MTWKGDQHPETAQPVSASTVADSLNMTGVAALWVGCISVVFPPAGLIAVVLGIAAWLETRADSQTRSRRVAMVAIVVGSLTTTLTIASIVWLGHRMLSEPRMVKSTVPSGIAAGHRVLAEYPRPSRAARTGATDLHAGVVPRKIGELTVVDLGPEIPSLSGALREQHRIATDSSRKLLVFVRVPDCSPCDDFSASLADEQMQSALRGTRLVRLDVVDFVAELARLNVPVEAFPGFALVGPDGRAVDYLHGGEWDADIPENIAPVLESFVKGTYERRRHHWRGGIHDDETPI